MATTASAPSPTVLKSKADAIATDDAIRKVYQQLLNDDVHEDVICARLLAWGIASLVQRGADPDAVMAVIELRLRGD